MCDMGYDKVWIQDREKEKILQLLVCDADAVLHEEIFIYKFWVGAQIAAYFFAAFAVLKL